MKRVRVVAALISAPDDPEAFLVQQRLPGGPRGSLWEFPGGKVEAGESDAEALVREGLEELGVELSVGDLLDSTVHPYADFTVELLLYAARIVNGTLRCTCAAQSRFLRPSQMRLLPFCEADVPLLERLGGAEPK